MKDFFSLIPAWLHLPLKIFIILIVLVFLDKYYFRLVLFVGKNLGISFFSNFFVRLGVIVHELSHLIMAILSGHKIKKVALFEKNGGYVVYEGYNLFSNIPDNLSNLFFWFFLVLYQFSVFLVSMAPLIVGVILTYFFVNYFSIDPTLQGVFSFLREHFLLFLLFSIFIPSFVISRKDFSYFIFSKQSNIIASLVASFFNILIFVGFLYFSSYFYDYLKLFFVLYLISFLFWIIMAVFVYILNYLLGKING